MDALPAAMTQCFTNNESGDIKAHSSDTTLYISIIVSVAQLAKYIAPAAGLTEKTVCVHLRHIFRATPEFPRSSGRTPCRGALSRDQNYVKFTVATEE